MGKIIIKEIFTPGEKRVLRLTEKLWNEFVKLDYHHQDEANCVRDAIHRIQSTICVRGMRSVNPKMFPKK